ncbi:MAG: sulfotransferase [Gemmatimonadales bacterium]|nr:sulfotransferase [Gemmatimonadales bacterium]
MVHLSRPTGTYVELSARQLYFGPKHVYALARRWQRYVAAAEEAGACLGEAAFLQVCYEDLMAAPEQELRRICAFLGKEFSAGMLTQYHEDDAFHWERRNARTCDSPFFPAIPASGARR